MYVVLTATLKKCHDLIYKQIYFLIKGDKKIQDLVCEIETAELQEKDLREQIKREGENKSKEIAKLTMEVLNYILSERIFFLFFSSFFLWRREGERGSYICITEQWFAGYTE